MTRISDVQLAQLARNAGFKHGAPTKGNIGGNVADVGELVVMVAVAIGESGPGNANAGANTTAHNDNSATGDDSYGLWQINMLGKLGPDRRKRYGLSSNQELFDPETNARVAYGIYSTEGKQGARHWSVYNSRKYLLYITRARRAVEGIGEEVPGTGDIPIIGDPIEDALGGIEQVVGFLNFVSDRENWKRVALFIGGALGLGIGLYMLVDSQTNVTNLVPVKRIAKAARRGSSG